MSWIVELLDARVRDELEALFFEMRARFRRIAELIQVHGLEAMREMRMKGRDGISRAIYVTARNRRAVVVRVFVKQTRKTPRREIDLALERARAVAIVLGAVSVAAPYLAMMNRIGRERGWPPSGRREYEALEEEFSLVAALIEARTRAGLTQEQVARRMKTTQAVIARLEGGGSKPSTRTLERYAEATGSRLRITFEPERARP